MGHNNALDKGKKKQKKGLWSPDEDQRLRDYVLKHGHGCWTNVSINTGLQRNGKSCRLRWLNYLRPGLKRGVFSREEEEIVLNLHKTLGNKWSQIAHKLPGRTDNEIKNYWHSYLKKKVVKMGETESPGKAECMNVHTESSSLNSSLESFGHIEGPLVDSCAQKSNLPRILFAEWLPFDQFLGCDSDSPPDANRNAFDNINGLNSQDVFIHNLLLNEETYTDEMLPKLDDSIDDMFQDQFEFEHQKSESEFAEYFPGEFNVNYDVMYI